MFIEAAKGALTAAEIYEKRAAIWNALVWLRLKLPGVPRVPLFGPGGTGKTTLGQMLSGKLDTDRSVAPYFETPEIEDLANTGAHLRLIRVAPGQVGRRPGNWDELYQDLSSGKATRIINVVAWGYHSTVLERVAIRTYSADMSDDEFRSKYLHDNREKELAALREIVPHLKASPGQIKMLTFITKQDLWWNQRVSVKAHYSEGEYATLLRSVREHKGAANFHHEFVSAALVQQNLKTADGFTLAETVTGYDDPLRLTNLDCAAETLKGLFS